MRNLLPSLILLAAAFIFTRCPAPMPPAAVPSTPPPASAPAAIVLPPTPTPRERMWTQGGDGRWTNHDRAVTSLGAAGLDVPAGTRRPTPVPKPGAWRLEGRRPLDPPERR